MNWLYLVIQTCSLNERQNTVQLTFKFFFFATFVVKKDYNYLQKIYSWMQSGNL